MSKTDSELENGKCPIHPNREVELLDEENYFFKFSLLQKPLLDLYNANPNLVLPASRFNEIRLFVERGLEDFSISRLKSKMPWGIEVPDDNNHVMYVWFDALTNYISTLGWPNEDGNFKYWTEGEIVQYCGKDNLRPQSAMWQAMLLASGIKNSQHIIIDGFITSGGQKMSKSLGNVISPFGVIDMFRDATEYPEEVLRFVLLHDVSSFEDGDLTVEGIKVSYQAYLANGIGNLTNRIMKMAINSGVSSKEQAVSSNTEIHNYLNTFDIKKAMEIVVGKINSLDKKIQTEEPFKVIKVDEEKGKKIIEELVKELYEIASLLEIFLPRTSAKILECIRENKMPEKPLFNRLP
mgnify:CR=1 FL=1